MKNFYHGSIVPEITKLEARSKLHNSEEKVVYLTDNVPYALFYIWDEKHNGFDGKHVTGWIKNGIAYYEEQFLDQLKTFYEGVSGYLYRIDDNYDIRQMENRDNMFFSINDVIVSEVVQITDVYEELLKYEAEGKLVVLRYSEQTVERQNELVELISQAIIRDNFYKENEMQQAFMKKYFSRAWKKAELEKIRESERKSHTEMYMNEELYNSDGCLKKPIKTVQELALVFDEYKELRVLDLGCGVGRNSIYIAEKFKNRKCIVDCVDLLDIAIEKLIKNAKTRDVEQKMNGIVKAIEEFEIAPQSYDFIIAISALEHIDTEESFLIKLHEIKNGLRENGIACFVINSNVTEMDLHTSEIVDAQFEINLPTEKLQA